MIAIEDVTPGQSYACQFRVETMLDDMIARLLDEGDTLSNANTLIYMGKIRDGMKVRRALYIAKHRGSACSEDIIPYHIDDSGIVLDI